MWKFGECVQIVSFPAPQYRKFSGIVRVIFMCMIVCGIVLGKAKTTKVGMVWYEFNIAS